jgi:hypothetical protein
MMMMSSTVATALLLLLLKPKTCRMLPHIRAPLEHHPASTAGTALLPLHYPGEERWTNDACQLQRARRWDSKPSADFQRQCDSLEVNRWNQNFLSDTHHNRLDCIARHSGLDESNIAKHARAAADALAVACAQLRRGEYIQYNQATQLRVHAAFAAYAAAAEAYNSERTSRLDALNAFHSTPPAQRGASWRAASSML